MGFGTARFGRATFGLQSLARAFNRVPLFVQQVLDAEQQLHILAAKEAVTAPRFLGRQLSELGLPVAQHVGLDTQNLADFTNLEVQLIGNLRGARLYRYIRHRHSPS